MNPCSTSPTQAHYWLVEPNRGPVSAGVCRYCGTKQDFYNSAEALYEGNVNLYFPIERVQKLERVEEGRI